MELRRGDSKKSSDAVKRLELELATWNEEREARDSYHLSLVEQRVRRTQRRLAGLEPEEKDRERPLNLSDSPELELIYDSIEHLSFSASQLRETIDHSLPETSLKADLKIMGMSLEIYAQSFEWLQKRLPASSTDTVKATPLVDQAIFPLNETQEIALKIIREEGPILGKNLAKRIGLEESSLRRHVIPSLKPHGVKSGRSGYYVPRSAT